ncbi:MBL fold metallo-hydrolase [Sphingomonas sp. KR1UV-12]|uniref:MBL fold metallo-hydrolase n=1 Tax=Sphingomonas aurea TaxID=3063994 RepID=A0ABT9EMT2_9SPHN|nr:MBL fold metallo-hydrolase [Sphingomonas sp. KR1UV-12]MDP1028263.1 MBL fold metallo-hydrolase [Sphingomonas sp. KR1UV-12]
MATLLGKILLWLVVVACLAVTIVPRFLDRRYYRGPVTDHFDSQRFANPDGDADTAAPPTGGSRAGFFWRYLLGDDGRPAWPDTVPVHPAPPAELMQRLPVPIVSAPATPDEAAATPMRATWIGHASVLVQTPDLNILTDPVWSEHTGPFGFGPRRVAAPGIAMDDLPRIDLILISHNHYDHLDLPTLKRIWARDRPLIVTSLGNDAILRDAGIPAQAADWHHAVTVMGRPRVARDRFWSRPVRVHVTRNHHWGSRWFADRNRALWSSFVVTLPGGNLFFAGDTGLGDGRWAAEAAALGPIRLALIPIGAFRFAAGQMASGSHIGPAQAVQVFAGLGAATAIPIHWGTFRLSYEGYRAPARLLRAAMACSGLTSRFAPVAIGRPVDIAPIAGNARPVPADAGALTRCIDTPATRAWQ